jgi:uncharacterized protein (TIGR00299 family) protein
MKILYYDCFSGISGDMNLGAMIDLGIEENYLVNELNKLNLQGWKLDVSTDQRHGIKGIKVTVRQTRHEHAHRHLSDIESIIDKSDLREEDKILSKKIFMKVAEAEAKVHGTDLEKVHFHEVGAIDSIIDIVGAAICFNALKVDEVYVSIVELGGGMVKCDHGMLPVPAPATAEIIKGIATRTGGVDFEATTPLLVKYSIPLNPFTLPEQGMEWAKRIIRMYLTFLGYSFAKQKVLRKQVTKHCLWNVI